MKQVLDYDQMQHLADLGLDIIDAGAYLLLVGDSNQLLLPNEHFEVFNDYYKVISPTVDDARYWSGEIVYPTYTLMDILNKLPKSIEDIGTLKILHSTSNTWCVEYSDNTVIGTYSNSLIDSAYTLLCWCIDSGYIKN